MHRSWTSAKRLWGDGGRCLSEPLQDRGLAGLQVCARPLAAGRNGRSGETGRRGRSLCHGGPSSIRRCSADLARESIKHSVIKHSATRGVRTVPPPLSTGTCGVLVAFCTNNLHAFGILPVVWNISGPTMENLGCIDTHSFLVYTCTCTEMPKSSTVANTRARAERGV